MEEEPEIVVKTIAIRPGISENRIWLQRISGPREGEGGDFNVDDLDALLSKFFKDNF